MVNASTPRISFFSITAVKYELLEVERFFAVDCKAEHGWSPNTSRTSTFRWPSTPKKALVMGGLEHEDGNRQSLDAPRELFTRARHSARRVVGAPPREKQHSALRTPPSTTCMATGSSTQHIVDNVDNKSLTPARTGKASNEAGQARKPISGHNLRSKVSLPRKALIAIVRRAQGLRLASGENGARRMLEQIQQFLLALFPLGGTARTSTRGSTPQAFLACWSDMTSSATPIIGDQASIRRSASSGAGR